ncbi:DUF4190 domain-containing protein [Arthrobacter sp. ERGS1:01]|uniref:DUF4190 domain-containing protein n=1 Tax=Arthrobacter sp. ERGS1:01 TaxID=1704044 RepID=UPI0006B3FDAE|nr:DUF4190 domain-containing protein [Arthrobacter sp. ERGS1:01]
MSSNNPENPYGQPTPYQQPSFTQPAAPASPYATNAPYGYAVPAEDPGKTLGIVGFILCFVCSIAGLIVSIIAKKKSRAAGFNNTLANVGVILGWIFTILGVIAIIFYIIAIVALMNSGATINGSY